MLYLLTFAPDTSLQKILNKSVPLLLLLIGCWSAGCTNSTKNKTAQPKVTKQTTDSLEKNTPDFLYALNLPELSTPFIGYLSNTKIKDTLEVEYDFSEKGIDAAVFIKGEKKKRLFFKDIQGVWLYDEGDLNGDGTNEIGLIAGYRGGACNSYFVYTYQNHVWKKLYLISSHMGDREKGIDYVKRIGDSVRILNANDDCCQCFGLDTTFEKIKL